MVWVVLGVLASRFLIHDGMPVLIKTVNIQLAWEEKDEGDKKKRKKNKKKKKKNKNKKNKKKNNYNNKKGETTMTTKESNKDQDGEAHEGNNETH